MFPAYQERNSQDADIDVLIGCFIFGGYFSIEDINYCPHLFINGSCCFQIQKVSFCRVSIRSIPVAADVGILDMVNLAAKEISTLNGGNVAKQEILSEESYRELGNSTLSNSSSYIYLLLFTV